MKKFLTMLALLPGAAFLAGCGRVQARLEPRDEPSKVTVRVCEVKLSDRGSGSTWLGTVQASKNTTLTAPVPGTLSSVPVKKGSKVKAGDVVAVVSSESVNSALEIAEAALSQAEDGYSRMMKLYEKGAVTEVKRMEVETQLRTARASRNAARKAKENCTIRAPFTGTVEEVFAEKGVEIGLLAPVLRIVDAGNMEIRFNVPENEIGSLREGDPVEVEVPALGRSLSLKVGLRDGSGNPLSHSYECTAYPGRVEGLKPGMAVKVGSRKAAGGKVLTVPASALFTGTEGRYVWLVRDGVVGKAVVKTDGYTDEGIIISEGLSPGDLVIVQGARKVCTGMKVDVLR